ncbi:hypothetical protein, partial [Streptomyces acidiscabies]|uniref:hypothetical protein n=1 Tax=Streptomyces acidiscabies TaxID=42234 RepID=UPI001C4CECE0
MRGARQGYGYGSPAHGRATTARHAAGLRLRKPGARHGYDCPARGRAPAAKARRTAVLRLRLRL